MTFGIKSETKNGIGHFLCYGRAGPMPRAEIVGCGYVIKKGENVRAACPGKAEGWAGWMNGWM